MNFLERLSGLFFPPGRNCLVCGRGAAVHGVCLVCRAQFNSGREYSLCRVCGRYEAEGKICPECLASPPGYFMARSLGPYGGVLKEAIYLFKYRGCRDMSECFGQLLADVFLREPGLAAVEMLVPVPLSMQKLQARGFNQSELLALKMGRLLALPVNTGLTRVKNTSSQSKLLRQARMENVRGAFSMTGSIRGKVLLIDDILTTGATAGECSRVLTRAGAECVAVLTLASGLQEKNK